MHGKTDASTSKNTRKSHAKNVKNAGVGDRLVDISSDENKMSGLSEADMIPDLNNAEDPIETENVAAKALVLATSSDEGTVSNHEPDKAAAQPLGKQKNGSSKKVAATDSEAKNGVRPKLLCMKLSETDTSDDEVKYRKRMEAKSQLTDPSGSAESDLNTNVAAVGGSQKRKTGKRRHIINSEDDESNDPDFNDEEENSDGDDVQEVDSDDSDNVTRKKPRRRRIKGSDSSEDDSESDRPKKRRRIRENSESNSDDDNKSKAGRHKIRKVIKDKHLTDQTKEAAAEERERRKRMEERQTLYNKMFKLPDNKEGSITQLILDFDEDTKQPLVEVHRKLVPKLKPHQARGIKFMWDACFESVAQIKDGKVPGGCILAHCMGLGKTLQTITLTHTVMENSEVNVDRVLVICPVNTVKNWEDEYEKWLKGSLELDVYGMSSDKDNWARADKMKAWFREGGVLIIGYDLFRNLTNEKNKKFKSKQRKIFNECLLDPGPDLVVCDEGHLLKNEKSAINKAVNRIKTLRRIILTGTPLQNNLKEYYEMVNFVKPNLLGTRKEFMNRFVNPIINGQHSDSTDRDIRTMKKRSFILNDLIKGCMQRLDYHVLVPYLQPKLEFVLSICMTDLQKRLYKFYLENYAKAGQVGLDGKLEGGKKGGLFYDVQNLSKIWNHPFILQLSLQRKAEKEDDDDEAGSLKDFICDDSDDDADDSEGSGNDIQEVEETKKRNTRQTAGNDDLVEGLVSEVSVTSRGWWNQLLNDEEQLDRIEFGSKMVLLIDILKECELIGDKVLVFSQSLLSLDLIEEFLANQHAYNEESVNNGSLPAGQIGTWVQGNDYYRLDGSTDANTRKIWCKYFNKETSHRMRLFLISTRAGGLGINLVAANRVIIFDASWNPSHDVQSIFRVYRFGQTKPVYVYRFLAKGTMEEKIYDRQVTKQSLAARVVDEQQIERHFTMNELAELYEFIDEPMSAKPLPAVPGDRLLADLVDRHKQIIWKFHHHDSLLENKVDENLTEDERKSAWEEYENEKKGFIQTNVGIDNINAFGNMLQGMLPMSGDGRVMASPINPMAIQLQLKSQNPAISHEELVMRTRAAILQLQNLHRTQTPVIMNEKTLGVGHRQGPGYDQSYYQQEMAKAKAMIQRQYPGMYRAGVGPGGSAGGQVMPQMAAVPKGVMIRQRAPMFARAEPEEITIEDDNDVPIVVPQQRVVPRARPAMTRGRGGRRGRPRLDPDTDLDFSPEPSSISTQQVIEKLKAQGMTVNKTTEDS